MLCVGLGSAKVAEGRRVLLLVATEVLVPPWSSAAAESMIWMAVLEVSEDRWSQQPDSLVRSIEVVVAEGAANVAVALAVGPDARVAPRQSAALMVAEVQCFGHMFVISASCVCLFFRVHRGHLLPPELVWYQLPIGAEASRTSAFRMRQRR